MSVTEGEFLDESYVVKHVPDNSEYVLVKISYTKISFVQLLRHSPKSPPLFIFPILRFFHFPILYELYLKYYIKESK